MSVVLRALQQDILNQGISYALEAGREIREID
jgi:hypothetical protein